jgi:phosphohistidine swiveling domain-containing protein
MKSEPRLILKGWAPSTTLRAEGYALIALTPNEAREKLALIQYRKKIILVCPSLDWSWSDVADEVAGVITDHGTRVSRGSEVSGIVQVPAVLGTKNSTTLITNNEFVEIYCDHNEAIAKVYSKAPQP